MPISDKNKNICSKLCLELSKNLEENIVNQELLLKAIYQLSTINLIEHAKKDPQYTTLYKLAETFEMSFDEFAK
jgi:transcriptional regulator with XRE-family HTH domain